MLLSQAVLHCAIKFRKCPMKFHIDVELTVTPSVCWSRVLLVPYSDLVAQVAIVLIVVLPKNSEFQLTLGMLQLGVVCLVTRSCVRFCSHSGMCPCVTKVLSFE